MIELGKVWADGVPYKVGVQYMPCATMAYFCPLNRPLAPERTPGVCHLWLPEDFQRWEDIQRAREVTYRAWFTKWNNGWFDLGSDKDRDKLVGLLHETGVWPQADRYNVHEFFSTPK